MQPLAKAPVSKLGQRVVNTLFRMFYFWNLNLLKDEKKKIMNWVSTKSDKNWDPADGQLRDDSSVFLIGNV